MSVCAQMHGGIAKLSHAAPRVADRNIPGGKVAAVGCNRHGVAVNAALVLKGVLAATRAHVPDVHLRVIYGEEGKGHDSGEA